MTKAELKSLQVGQRVSHQACGARFYWRVTKIEKRWRRVLVRAERGEQEFPIPEGTLSAITDYTCYHYELV